MKIGEVISTQWVEVTRLQSLVPLLRDRGIDLCAAGHADPPERGTPSYVWADADAQVVQRRMAEAHVRLVFVLQDDRIVGAIDLVDLIERADELVWEGAISSTNH